MGKKADKAKKDAKSAKTGKSGSDLVVSEETSSDDVAGAKTKCPHCKNHCALTHPRCKKGRKYAKKHGVSSVSADVEPGRQAVPTDVSEVSADAPVTSKKPKKADKPKKGKKSKKGDKSKKGEKAEKSKKGEKAEKPKKGEKAEKPKKGEKADKPDTGLTSADLMEEAAGEDSSGKLEYQDEDEEDDKETGFGELTEEKDSDEKAGAIMTDENEKKVEVDEEPIPHGEGGPVHKDDHKTGVVAAEVEGITGKKYGAVPTPPGFGK